jgi:hypothetical protein
VIASVGFQYGMLDKCNVCFYNGEIKLLLGESNMKNFPGENAPERDLRVLGFMMTELSSCRSLQNNSLE